MYTENRTQICTKFSENEEFVVDCPYSTMCMKKLFQYQLQDGTKIETVSRKCADQKHIKQVIELKSSTFVLTNKHNICFLNSINSNLL